MYLKEKQINDCKLRKTKLEQNESLDAWNIDYAFQQFTSHQYGVSFVQFYLNTDKNAAVWLAEPSCNSYCQKDCEKGRQKDHVFL